MAQYTETYSEYYLENTRAMVGNSMSFWAINDLGYTTDISRAKIFTKAQALHRMSERSYDVAWPKAHIDQICKPVADFQNANRALMLSA